jgi:hypothetical protein
MLSLFVLVLGFIFGKTFPKKFSGLSKTFGAQNYRFAGYYILTCLSV